MVLCFECNQVVRRVQAIHSAVVFEDVVHFHPECHRLWNLARQGGGNAKARAELAVARAQRSGT